MCFRGIESKGMFGSHILKEFKGIECAVPFCDVWCVWLSKSVFDWF